MNCVLLFPPNWSACTSGPHLALPLVAGATRSQPEWNVETWDLHADFCRRYSATPSRDAIRSSVLSEDYAALDKLYFAWEDEFKGIAADRSLFGLLSGFEYPHLNDLAFSDAVVTSAQHGSVYTPFFTAHVLPRLAAARPSVIGVTIASANQLMPAVELLCGARAAVPDAFIVLGGNVVTRLRNSSAFGVLAGLVDQTVLFQGELALAQSMEMIERVGAAKAKSVLPAVVGDESIACHLWPVPSFRGLDLSDSIGPTVLPYVSTRGCYWSKCRFCAIPAGWSSTGYGGSAPASQVAAQMEQIVGETGVARLKFVDESMPVSKVRQLSDAMASRGLRVEWEAYARLETAWADVSLLEAARRSGLRKLYFGMEQAPSASRELLGKNDSGDPLSILRACYHAGIKAHLFCMVGYPGTSRKDAELTTRFLLDNRSLIDTADLVGFHLDRGTTVPGVRPRPDKASDWALSLPYEPAEDGVLSPSEVCEIETACQEALWEAEPRLLHPLYRVVGPWDNTGVLGESDVEGRQRMCACSVSS